MSTRGAERPSEAEFEEVRAARDEHPGRDAPNGGRAAEHLSMRDWFAGKALSAVLAARVAAGDDISQESIAEECYELADAMLVERAKRRTV